MSVSTVVQVPAPAGERWKASEATPVPPGSEPEPVSETVPRRLAPGSSWEAEGAVLSTVTVASRRGVAVSSHVGDDGPQLVVPVSERARVPGDGVGRARVGVDRGPGAATGGAALEEDGVHTGAARIGSGPGDRHGPRDERPVRRRTQRAGRVGVVHPPVDDRGRGGRVTGVVGDDHAQVVEPVRNAGRVEGGRGRRPGASASGRVLIGAVATPEPPGSEAVEESVTVARSGWRPDCSCGGGSRCCRPGG